MASEEIIEKAVNLVEGDATNKKKKKKKKKKGEQSKVQNNEQASPSVTPTRELNGDLLEGVAQNELEVLEHKENVEGKGNEEQDKEEEVKRNEEVVEEAHKKEEEEKKKVEMEEERKSMEEERKREEEEERKRIEMEEERKKIEKEEEEEKKKIEEKEREEEKEKEKEKEKERKRIEEEEIETVKAKASEAQSKIEIEQNKLVENASIPQSLADDKEPTATISKEHDGKTEEENKEWVPTLGATTSAQNNEKQSENSTATSTASTTAAPTNDTDSQRRETYENTKQYQRVAEEDISLFTRFDAHKHVVLPKSPSESLGFMITETSRQSLLPCIFISHIFPGGAASRSGELMVGDSILNINGTSVVGLPFPTILDLFKAASKLSKIELIVVPVEPVREVTIDRSGSPSGKLGFDILHGEVISVNKDGPAHLAGLRAGHQITEVNGVSVVGLTHERIVELLQ
eukprot:Ihof_evm9s87 gene=Ihof_evmTU9s87